MKILKDYFWLVYFCILYVNKKVFKNFTIIKPTSNFTIIKTNLEYGVGAGAWERYWTDKIIYTDLITDS